MRRINGKSTSRKRNFGAQKGPHGRLKRDPEEQKDEGKQDKKDPADKGNKETPEEVWSHGIEKHSVEIPPEVESNIGHVSKETQERETRIRRTQFLSFGRGGGCQKL